MTNKGLFIIPFMALALLGSCHSAEEKRVNQQAINCAIEAAEKVLAIDSEEPVDSAKLEYAVIEARATQFEFENSGVEGAGEEFSRTFRDSITARSPQLAAQIFTKNQDK